MKLTKKEIKEDIKCDLEIVDEDLQIMSKAIYQIMDKIIKIISQ